MVEVERERRDGFFREASVEFAFHNDQRLKDFVEYVTDVRNAPVVFQSGFYRITRLWTEDGTSDPDFLRRVGANFNFKGELLVLPVRTPIEVNLEVVKYDIHEGVEVVSRRVAMFGITSHLQLEADWHFKYAGDNHEKPEAELTARCRCSNSLLQYVARFTPQLLVNAQMDKIGYNIAQDFRNKTKKGGYNG